MVSKINWYLRLCLGLLGFTRATHRRCLLHKSLSLHLSEVMVAGEARIELDKALFGALVGQGRLFLRTHVAHDPKGHVLPHL